MFFLVSAIEYNSIAALNSFVRSLHPCLMSEISFYCLPAGTRGDVLWVALSEEQGEAGPLLSCAFYSSLKHKTNAYY